MLARSVSTNHAVDKGLGRCVVCPAAQGNSRYPTAGSRAGGALASCPGSGLQRLWQEAGAPSVQRPSHSAHFTWGHAHPALNCPHKGGEKQGLLGRAADHCSPGKRWLCPAPLSTGSRENPAAGGCAVPVPCVLASRAATALCSHHRFHGASSNFTVFLFLKTNATNFCGCCSA